jgi:hypothetical protein
VCLLANQTVGACAVREQQLQRRPRALNAVASARRQPGAPDYVHMVGAAVPVVSFIGIGSLKIAELLS